MCIKNYILHQELQLQHKLIDYTPIQNMHITGKKLSYESSGNNNNCLVAKY